VSQADADAVAGDIPDHLARARALRGHRDPSDKAARPLHQFRGEVDGRIAPQLRIMGADALGREERTFEMRRQDAASPCELPRLAEHRQVSLIGLGAGRHNGRAEEAVSKAVVVLGNRLQLLQSQPRRIKGHETGPGAVFEDRSPVHLQGQWVKGRIHCFSSSKKPNSTIYLRDRVAPCCPHRTRRQVQ
jgi:hypothetical protein